MEIRQARPDDAAGIARLIGELGYPVSPAMIVAKLSALSTEGLDAVLVAAAGDRLGGCIGLHAMPLLHVEGRLGRITALVVDTPLRGQGIGAALLARAHAWFEQSGCVKIEVTSGDQRLRAHRFYLSHGYHRHSQRFVRGLVV